MDGEDWAWMDWMHKWGVMMDTVAKDWSVHSVAQDWSVDSVGQNWGWNSLLQDYYSNQYTLIYSRD